MAISNCSNNMKKWHKIVSVGTLGLLAGTMYAAPVKRAPVQAVPAPGMHYFPGNPLSQFPDEKQVYCPQYILISLPTNTDFLVDAHISKNAWQDGYVWPLIKHNGILYVRAWVMGQPSAKMFKEHPMVIGSESSALDGMHKQKLMPHQVTFRVDKARWSNTKFSRVGWQTIRVWDIALDNHAYEKWNP